VIHIHKILISIVAMALAFMTPLGAYAAPNNSEKADNNPHVVAYYPTGLHAIPTDPITYLTGTNLVTERGNSGQIEAWYTGEDGHGYHSVWNVQKGGQCVGTVIPNAYPTWGDYLTPGADYCVTVNSF
jgi:hypothetical protein